MNSGGEFNNVYVNVIKQNWLLLVADVLLLLIAVLFVLQSAPILAGIVGVFWLTVNAMLVVQVLKGVAAARRAATNQT